MDGTSTRESSNFSSFVKDEIEVSSLLLDSTIDWIQKNLTPSQVFDDSDLKDWAEANGYEKK